ALRAFMIALWGLLQTKVSLEMLLHLLFERSGARMETNSQVVYWVNTAGLSVPYRRVLTEIVNGLCALDVRDQGKPIGVRLKDMSPGGRSNTTVEDRMLSWFQTCCGGRNHGTGAGVEHTTNRLDTGDGAGLGRLADRSRTPHHATFCPP